MQIYLFMSKKCRTFAGAKVFEIHLVPLRRKIEHPRKVLRDNIK